FSEIIPLFVYNSHDGQTKVCPTIVRGAGAERRALSRARCYISTLRFALPTEAPMSLARPSRVHPNGASLTNNPVLPANIDLRWRLNGFGNQGRPRRRGRRIPARCDLHSRRITKWS